MTNTNQIMFTETLIDHVGTNDERAIATIATHEGTSLLNDGDTDRQADGYYALHGYAEWVERRADA